MLRVCPECGEELLEEDIECPNCGLSVQDCVTEPGEIEVVERSPEHIEE